METQINARGILSIPIIHEIFRYIDGLQITNT